MRFFSRVSSVALCCEGLAFLDFVLHFRVPLELEPGNQPIEARRSGSREETQSVLTSAAANRDAPVRETELGIELRKR